MHTIDKIKVNNIDVKFHMCHVFILTLMQILSNIIMMTHHHHHTNRFLYTMTMVLNLFDSTLSEFYGNGKNDTNTTNLIERFGAIFEV